jgi:sugar transferase (PEP-CTERM/EpsH1 system associated)
MTRRPLIVHIVHRFDTGGLENGVVNLINHMPADAYEHRVVAVTEVTNFRLRLRHADVECYALHKPPGHGAMVYPRLWRLLREWRPAIVHTRNLAALEMQAAAWAAGVPARIHGEHGRDLQDIADPGWRYRFVRRIYSPFVQRYIALSNDLAGYLHDEVGIAHRRVVQIYNGVDEDCFRPPALSRETIDGLPFRPGEHWLVGTVGRMQPIKNQTLLVNAFVQACMQHPQAMDRARLVMIGDGPLRSAASDILRSAGLSSRAWLPGERDDVPEILRALDCFVLPSKSEGISNSILEAMATALPVIATAVGGNSELVSHGRTGEIVPPDDVAAMARAIGQMATDRELARQRGREGRSEVERRFSLRSMVAAYRAVYDHQIRAASGGLGAA